MYEAQREKQEERKKQQHIQFFAIVLSRKFFQESPVSRKNSCRKKRRL
jgi:hypothetical protein